MIHAWQLGCFCILSTITGILQVYLYYNLSVDLGYDGLRINFVRCGVNFGDGATESSTDTDDVLEESSDINVVVTKT